MGPLFVLIFWGIIATPILIVLLILWRKKSPVAIHAKKSILAAVATIAIVFGALFLGHLLSGLFPSHVFETSFGFAPPRDVTDLQGYSFIFGENGETFLRFRADQ